MKKIRMLTAAAVAGIYLLTGGCGSKKTETVSVQSVAMLNGVTTEMNLEKYAGVVTSGTVTSVKKEDGRQIANVAVKKGDQVTKGQVLFTYDVESTQNDLDKQQLELQQIQNTITAKTAERQQLAADKKKAKADEQLDYTLKIQEADTDIREAQYNLGLKQKEINKTKALLTDLSVSAPVSGTVTFIGSNSSAGSGTGTDEEGSGADTSEEGTDVEEAGTDSSATADDMITDDGADGGDTADGASDGTNDSGSGSSTYMKIEETGILRIKGMVNEENIANISKGMPMVVRSRTDDQQMWRGTITSINTSKPASDNNANGYGQETDTMTQSSKYPFYVTLDNPEGLMIGQHVYLEQDVGQENKNTEEIRLPADFIVDAATSTPIVWMEDDGGLLTTRGVQLGDYRKSDNSYAVTSGLTMDDYVAYPDSSLKKGMKCKEQETSDSDAVSEADSMTDSMTGYADSGTSVVFDDPSEADSQTEEAGMDNADNAGETPDAPVIGGGVS